jgi:hypothetical protein
MFYDQFVVLLEYLGEIIRASNIYVLVAASSPVLED